MQAVDKHYSFARRDVALRVVFKQSKISLDIPEEGKLINEGWKILPRTPPYVRHYVIYFCKSNAVACIRLEVSVVLVWLYIIRFSFSKKASEEENLVLVLVS